MDWMSENYLPILVRLPGSFQALPVRSAMGPDVPPVLEPVANDSEPLMPVVPASSDLMLNEPLDLARP